MDDLIQSLRRGGCRPIEVTSDTSTVEHPDAADDHVARIELEFFLKAWVAQNSDVDAEILD